MAAEDQTFDSLKDIELHAVELEGEPDLSIPTAEEHNASLWRNEPQSPSLGAHQSVSIGQEEDDDRPILSPNRRSDDHRGRYDDHDPSSWIEKDEAALARRKKERRRRKRNRNKQPKTWVDANKKTICAVSTLVGLLALGVLIWQVAAIFSKRHNNNNGKANQKTENVPVKMITDCDRAIQHGNCSYNITRFGYSVKEDKCVSFIWGGCGGSQNRYNTIEECEHVCMGKEIKVQYDGKSHNDPICDQPWVAGACNDNITRFAWMGSGCERVNYSGCGGSENIFMSLLECVDMCPGVPCKTDDHCGSDAFCEVSTNLEDSAKHCKPYQKAGELCGGYTELWMANKCGPGLKCTLDEAHPDKEGHCENQ